MSMGTWQLGHWSLWVQWDGQGQCHPPSMGGIALWIVGLFALLHSLWLILLAGSPAHFNRTADASGFMGIGGALHPP